MRIEEYGVGVPVVLLHGGGVSGWMWRPVIEELGPDVRVVVPDLPGHGRSTDAPYRSHDETIEALVEALGARIDGGFHLVGFSLGAQLAILLAARRPDLVLSATIVSAETKPAPFAGATLWMLGVAAPLARIPSFARAQARQLSVPPALMEHYIRDSSAMDRETLVASVGQNLGFILPPEWAGYPGAATVLVGQRERGLMLASARLACETRAGTALVIVPGAGHDIPFSRPDVLASIIAEHAAV